VTSASARSVRASRSRVRFEDTERSAQGGAMPTENPSASRSPLVMLRARTLPAWKWLESQPALLRWSFAAVGLIALVAGAYFAIFADSSEYEWLNSGHAFAYDEVLKIRRVLGEQGIPFQADSGRVGVPHDRLRTAQ